MALTKRVHFLMDPEQFAALERLARSQPRLTGERMTVGSLFREAVTEYLTQRGKLPASRPAQRKRRVRP